MFSHVKAYTTVIHTYLKAFLMTPRLVWTVEAPLQHDDVGSKQYKTSHLGLACSCNDL